MGAGQDKMVQTRPIISPKTKCKDAANANIHAKPKEQGDNQAKPKEQESSKSITGYKRPIAEPRREARDKNKVQEPRDTGDEPNDIPKAEDENSLQVKTKEKEDNGERQEQVGNLGGNYYLPADPRLVEVHDYSALVPCTGADRSTPKSPIASNPLYSQHKGDNQHKNDGSEPIDKNQHAKIVTGEPGDGARYQGTGSQEADEERDDERDDDKDATNGSGGGPCLVPCPYRPLPGPLPIVHPNKEKVKEETAFFPVHCLE